MDSLELNLIRLLRVLIEVALFTLLGQGLLGLLAGQSRDKNFVYQLFKIITAPVIRVVRLITPRIIIDRHIGTVAFFLLLWLWLLLAFAKRYVCAAQGLNCT